MSLKRLSGRVIDSLPNSEVEKLAEKLNIPGAKTPEKLRERVKSFSHRLKIDRVIYNVLDNDNNVIATHAVSIDQD